MPGRVVVATSRTDHNAQPLLPRRLRMHHEGNLKTVLKERAANARGSLLARSLALNPGDGAILELSDVDFENRTDCAR